MYAGSYSGTMIYSQKNIDKLTHSNKVKSIVDQLGCPQFRKKY